MIRIAPLVFLALLLSVPSVAAPTKSLPVGPAAAVGAAVFPTTLDKKYSGEKPGEQNMNTRLDQYHTNKATNANC